MAAAANAFLRELQTADYAVLAAWLPHRQAMLDWCASQPALPLSAAGLAVMLQEGPARSRVWATDGSPIGFGQILITQAGTAQLTRLIVDPSLRRQGHGRAMCQALIAAAEEEGAVRTVTVECRRDDIATRNLCARFGFQEVPGGTVPPWLFLRRMVRRAV